ncbi:hypothetical protein L6452_39552 [Arctium lappa]|uniref:Uncharacterized protein n=1 Tax=Arctium lappa TaxID=4217 RepID=A0ACB8XTS4_ARCLA|nr:hypothetical protein L6452_39552 [Arctium lappa]
MDYASLQSKMDTLVERALMLEIEKGLVSIFVNSHVNQLAEVVGKEIDGFSRENVEKSEIEKSNSEKESEIGDLNRQLEVEIDTEKLKVSRVCDEIDDIRVQLDARIQEVDDLQLKVIQTDKKEARRNLQN